MKDFIYLGNNILRPYQVFRKCYFVCLCSLQFFNSLLIIDARIFWNYFLIRIEQFLIECRNWFQNHWVLPKNLTPLSHSVKNTSKRWDKCDFSGFYRMFFHPMFRNGIGKCDLLRRTLSLSAFGTRMLQWFTWFRYCLARIMNLVLLLWQLYGRTNMIVSVATKWIYN